MRKLRLRIFKPHKVTQLGSLTPEPKQYPLQGKAAPLMSTPCSVLLGWMLTDATSFICKTCGNKGSFGLWESSKEAKEPEPSRPCLSGSGNRQYSPEKALLGAGMMGWVPEGTVGLETPCLSIAGWGEGHRNI